MHLFGKGCKNRSIMFLAMVPAKPLFAMTPRDAMRTRSSDKRSQALLPGTVVKL